MWGFGLLLGLILVFLTNGSFWLLLPGGVVVHHLAGHRLGFFRYDINYWAIGIITFAGPLATITLGVLFKALSGVAAGALIPKIIIFNIFYALYILVPIPSFD